MILVIFGSVIGISGIFLGLMKLLRCMQVTHIQGYGRISGTHEVTVELADGSKQKVATKNIMIAAGSEVTPFPGIQVGGTPHQSSALWAPLLLVNKNPLWAPLKVINQNHLWAQ